MVVTVRLLTTLRRKTEQGWQDRLELELEPGATAASVLEALGLAGRAEGIILVVNRRTAAPTQPLNHGDEVRLMPAISGGTA